MCIPIRTAGLYHYTDIFMRVRAYILYLFIRVMLMRYTRIVLYYNTVVVICIVRSALTYRH